MTDNTLAQTCTATADAALNALKWFADPENEELVGAVRPQLQKEFRRYANQARTLSEAVDRPMCVGLFGESQAGKSYLAAGLSRNGTKPLYVRFNGEEDKEFINKINPEGDRESTGVVTRFSIKDISTPEGFPVALRLLSETDIIKILGNSYFMDSSPKTLSAIPIETLAEIMSSARSKAGSGDGQFPVERVWDLQDYFYQQFGHLSPMTGLTEYWAEAEELAPLLDIEGRAILFSPLWGVFEKLTQTYKDLTDALSRLGFPADAYAGIDALIPRSKSIIDVETLKGLGDPKAETLAVRTMRGSAITLPRPVVTAIIAELRLVITEGPWPLFDHTDVLDFPGARNRDPIDMQDFLQKDDALKQLIVRGKVAYLFDRYVASQELTSMLLVLKPSNQNITSLPSLVSDWIDRTHGDLAEIRNGRPTLLFMVFSWFNDMLKRKPSEDEDDLGVRFKSRMTGTIPGFFGKSHDWPSKWTVGKPFQNCFWLRDPSFSKETFETNDKGEVEVKADEVDRINRMKEAYLKVDEVQAHFADPSDAWDKAMLVNDGGVSHLANSLAPVCEPEMKKRQVAARLGDLRKQMMTTLANYHVSDNVEKRIAERRAVADDVLISIEHAGNARKFAGFLRILQIKEGFLQDHLYRYSRKPTVVVEPEEGEEPAPRRRSRFSRDAAPQNVANPEPAPKPKDKATLFCEEMISAWTIQISERADSERIAKDLHVPVEHLKEVVTELTGAARRLDLGEQIAVELRRFSFVDGPDRAITRNSVIGARRISNFVSTLGFDQMPEAQRPTVAGPDGVERPVFRVPPFVFSQIKLPTTPDRPEESYLDDWGFAFMRLVDDNASSSKGQSVNRKQNAALGQILDVLGTSVGGDA